MVMAFVPEQDLELKWSNFTKCLKESPSGTAPGPGGCTNEFLQVCLDDEVDPALVSGRTRSGFRQSTSRSIRVHVGEHDCIVKNRWWCARNPRRALPSADWWRSPLAKASLTQKGESLRPIPVRAVNSEDCVRARGATWQPISTFQNTVLSIDGVGAHDHVLQDFGGGKLFVVCHHSFRQLMLNPRAIIGKMCAVGFAKEDIMRVGSRGDTLMPIPFCFAVHNALDGLTGTAPGRNTPSAFLDGGCVLSAPERTLAIYKLSEVNVFALQQANIRRHTGKTRTWNRTN